LISKPPSKHSGRTGREEDRQVLKVKRKEKKKKKKKPIH